MINKQQVRRLLRNEDGATAIEYSMIAASMALVLVPALSATTSGLGSLYTIIAGFWDNY